MVATKIEEDLQVESYFEKQNYQQESPMFENNGKLLGFGRLYFFTEGNREVTNVYKQSMKNNICEAGVTLASTGWLTATP